MEMTAKFELEQLNSTFNASFTQTCGGGGSSGGSDLPTVTEEDNGKVLQVEDSKWTKKHLPPCDDELSQMSVNAVQNKVVTAEFAKLNLTIGNIDALLETI